jgi:serine/threonine protein kinase
MSEPGPDDGTPAPFDPAQLNALLDEQKQRFERGQGVRVEELIADHLALRDDPEALLDLIHREFNLRELAGESPCWEEYHRRFPPLEAQLAILSQLHEAWPDEPAPFDPGPGPAWPLIAGYQILDLLGRGGMGTVYLARDLARGVLVALKTLHGSTAATPYTIEREFRALKGVVHENLVNLHELVVSDEGHRFIVMEYIKGNDFLTYVRSGSSERVGPSGVWERLRAAFRQLASAVVTLHGAKILHRDLKPSNVRVTPEGRVVVMDFGLAAEAEGSRVSVVGTVSYIPPEGATVGPASDWYSVGVILYQALTGRLPLDPPDKRDFTAGAPDDLCRLCLRLLAPDAHSRPDGAEVLRELDASDHVAPPWPRPGPVPLVGRERHVRDLEDAYEATRRGRTVSLLVHGRSGAGKTVLLDYFRERLARRSDALVLCGRCGAHEALGYKAFHELINTALKDHLLGLKAPHEVEALLPRDIGPLIQVFTDLKLVDAIARSPRAGSKVPDEVERRRRAFNALRELLARLGDRHRLVLIYTYETTASGRATRRASSDPAYLLLSPPRLGPRVLGASLRRQRTGDASLVRVGSSELLAPDGGYRT